jgi:hypothetical protein
MWISSRQTCPSCAKVRSSAADRLGDGGVVGCREREREQNDSVASRGRSDSWLVWIRFPPFEVLTLLGIGWRFL